MALKKFNPTTPGRRGLVLVNRAGLWKGDPVKALTEGLSKKGGRNNTGRITARRRASGISWLGEPPSSLSRASSRRACNSWS